MIETFLSSQSLAGWWIRPSKVLGLPIEFITSTLYQSTWQYSVLYNRRENNLL
jgi:hypothetical protein